jgi:hypothetical protein
MVWLGLLLYFGENYYYGGNLQAKSFAEHVCDTLSTVLITWGILGAVAQEITVVRITNIDRIDHFKAVTKDAIFNSYRAGDIDGQL